MKRLLLLTAGATMALTSVWAVAQDSPESLLPPGFEKPKAKPPASPGTGPMIQPIPGELAGASGGPAKAPSAPRTLPNGQRIPTLRELEAMTPDQLDELLGLKPKFDMPSAARRSLKQVGVLDESEGGFPAGSLGRQNPRLVQALLEGNKGRIVSRWGHMLLRRALVSRMDAPAGMNPADFAGWRAAVLVRMGEGDLARALVQDVDAGNYTPPLTNAAIEAYAFTADITGICPVVMVQGGVRKDADWRVLRAICSSFQGDGAAGMGQLDRLSEEKAWPKVDLLLAQKYAGAVGKSRRAVKIEWDGVSGMTPWRYALSIAVGIEPPADLMKDAPRRYALSAATAPMLGLEARASAADKAAAAGILSSTAMVDLYSQIYTQQDIKGDWASAAETLRTAYVGASPGDKMAAMRNLWQGGSDVEARYSRQILTAYAAARMPVSGDFSGDIDDLVGSMLAAGLDQNALKWADQANVGSVAWGMLALVTAPRSQPVDGGALNSFYSNDPSDEYRKSQFLLAGLAGLDRLESGAAKDFADKLEIDLDRTTNWTRLIQQAADLNNRELVVLLAGIGMQGDSWARMTPLHLYHIVSALNRVGLSAEARMIAAEAVARG